MIIGDAKNKTLLPSVVIASTVTVVGIAAPLDPTFEYVLVAAVAWAIAAIGLDVLVGYSGQVSFGQAAFVALGAYTTSAFRIYLGMPTLLAAVLGIACTAAIAFLLGSIVVRYRIFGIAVSTLFFGYVVYTVFTGDLIAPVFGGPNGLSVPPFELVGTGTGLMAVAGVVLILVVLVTCVFVNSQTGRAMRLVKTNEAVAAAAGIRVARTKVLAFVYCCVLGALGGVLYSGVVGFISPDSFAIAQSVNIFAMLVVGGAGSVGGPILGALLVTILPGYFLRDGHVSAIIFAAVLLVFLVALPEGIYGLGQRLWAVVSRRFGRRHGRQQAGTIPDEAPASADAGAAESARVRDRVVTEEDSGPALETIGLEVRFNDFVALSDVNLRVRSGGIHAIIGPNGAGKTTLLNAISGLYAASAGDIRYLGDSIEGLRPFQIRRRGVVRTFQTPAIVPDLDVIDNVKLGLDSDERHSVWADLIGRPLTGRRERALQAEARWALDAVGIPAERHGMLAKSLDLSEQKRVEIARGLVGHARLLLLDEPTAGLSVKQMESLAATLRQVHDRFGLTIVLISHHIGFILDIADEMTVLDYGRVIGAGEPAEVLSRPEIATTFMGADAEPEEAGV